MNHFHNFLYLQPEHIPPERLQYNYSNSSHAPPIGPTIHTNEHVDHYFSLLRNLSSLTATSSAAASNDDSTDVVLVNVLINFPFIVKDAISW